jgi:hypothetical protein
MASQLRNIGSNSLFVGIECGIELAGKLPDHVHCTVD